MTTANDGFDLLRAEFSKSQFMTTTAGPGARPGTRRYSVEFTSVGDDGPEADAARQRMNDLHAAFVAAAGSLHPSEGQTNG